MRNRRARSRRFAALVRRARHHAPARGHQAHPRALPAPALPLPQADGRPLSFRSQAQQHRPACAAFFRCLARQNLILLNPAADLELPQERAAPPAGVLTAAGGRAGPRQPDVEDPSACATAPSSRPSTRPASAAASSCTSGVYDLDPDRGTLIVRQGKGKKDRMVPIGERALAWIEKYLDEVRPELVVEPDDGDLFLSLPGEPLALAWLTDSVRRLRRRAPASARRAPATSSATPWRP